MLYCFSAELFKTRAALPPSPSSVRYASANPRNKPRDERERGDFDVVDDKISGGGEYGEVRLIGVYNLSLCVRVRIRVRSVRRVESGWERNVRFGDIIE